MASITLILVSLNLNIFLWATVYNKALKMCSTTVYICPGWQLRVWLCVCVCSFLYFFLIALQNPSSEVLIGCETLQLAGNVLTIYLEVNYKYTEMKIDEVSMPPGFQLEISNISNFFNLASFKFY